MNGNGIVPNVDSNAGIDKVGIKLALHPILVVVGC